MADWKPVAEEPLTPALASSLNVAPPPPPSNQWKPVSETPATESNSATTQPTFGQQILSAYQSADQAVSGVIEQFAPDYAKS